MPGTDGFFNSVARWDPDGPGPLTERLIFVGRFTAVGTTAANTVASLDPVSGVWANMGSGLAGEATCLLPLANGGLLLGLSINTPTGFAASVLQWNGSGWAPVGATFDGSVSCLAELPGGTFIAGGAFQHIGTTAASNIAVWNGASWTAIGSGVNTNVSAIQVTPSGQLFIGGGFTSAGGVPVGGIARWNGFAWQAVGSGTNGHVEDLAVAANGDIIAAGSFTAAGGVAVHNIARWNGSTWSSLGDPGCSASAVTLTASGSIVLTGGTSALVGVVKRFDGIAWTTLSNDCNPPPQAVVSLPSGDLFVAGSTQSIDGLLVAGVARFDGQSWHSLTSSVRKVVFAIGASGTSPTAVPLLASGGDAITLSRVAKRNGSWWSDLGSPDASSEGRFGDTYAILGLPNDQVVVGGTSSFGLGQGISLRAGSGIWSPMAGGVNGTVYALAKMANGDIVAGGNFTTAGGVPANRIARWNGSTWSPMGSGMNSDVYALTFMPNDENPLGGVLFAGGLFTTAGGNPASYVAAWYGSWLGISNGMNDAVHALCSVDDRDLIAGGVFTTASGSPASRVAKWNGGPWQACGTGTSGPVYALAPLNNGSFIAGGSFANAGGVVANNIARFSGTTWTALGTGSDGSVMSLTTLPNGDVWAGGYFTTMNGLPSHHVARLDNLCPATATSYLLGCPSSGGSNTLTATTLPWIETMFRATATGLPPTAIVLTLTSVTPIAQGTLPLTTVFPQAGIGCDVLTMPDLLGLLITTNGTAQSQLFLPNSSPLIGLPFYHQMVAIEVDAQGTWSAVTATNALQVVAGSL